jgi:hypothetical protein
MWASYCDRSSDSEEALCETCDRSFGSGEVLEQHLWDSRIHQQDTETPLDIFSRSFPTFDYGPSLPPATSNANLREYEGWRRSHAKSDDT